MIKELYLKLLRKGWLRGLRVKKDIFWTHIWGLSCHIDPRLRAFLWASMVEFPELRFMITSTKRNPPNDRSGHNWMILSAFDLRSRDWELKDLIKYKNWADFWWEPLIDVILEDERFDKKYKGKAPHIHIEIDSPYWRRI